MPAPRRTPDLTCPRAIEGRKTRRPSGACRSPEGRTHHLDPQIAGWFDSIYRRPPWLPSPFLRHRSWRRTGRTIPLSGDECQRKVKQEGGRVMSQYHCQDQSVVGGNGPSTRTHNSVRRSFRSDASCVSRLSHVRSGSSTCPGSSGRGRGTTSMP